MVEVYVMSIARALAAGLSWQSAIDLPPESRLRLNRYKRAEDADRSGLAEVLLRHVIRSKSGAAAARLPFGRTRYGKPYLPGFGDLQFNLSHSGDWAACAFHHRPVGIDIERIRLVETAIVLRYFTPEEQTAWLGLPESRRLDGFFDLWTCKESYLKAEGLGFSLPLNAFTVELRSREAQARPRVDGLAERSIRLYPMEDYRMAVCAETADYPPDPVAVTAEEIAACCAERSSLTDGGMT